MTANIWVINWQAGGFMFVVYHQLTRIFGGNPYQIFIFLIGMWIGLSTLWLLDTYKKSLFFVPLVFLSTVILTLVKTTNVLQPGPVLRADYLIVFVAALIFSVSVIGQVPFISWIRPPRGKQNHLMGPPPRSIPQSPYIIFVSVAVAVVLGLLDFHLFSGDFLQLSENNDLAINVLAGGTLIFCFYETAEYRRSVRVLLLGPARAGKTAVLAGLYNDIEYSKTESSSSDSGYSLFDSTRYIESTSSNRLKKIARNLRNGKLPDRTDEEGTEYIEIEYVSGHQFFRKKTTVSGFDYRGEILFDRGTETENLGFINTLEGIRNERTVVERLLHRFGAIDYWNRAIEEQGNIDPRWADKDHPEIETVAKLADTADHLILTLPIDDFLNRVIERENIRGYYPYFKIEKSGNDQFDLTLPNNLDILRDKNAWEADLLDEFTGSETVNINRQDGELRFDDLDRPCPEPNFESVEYLIPVDKDTTYSHMANRTNPQIYTEQLEGFIDKLQEKGAAGRKFTWIFTMADLVAKDFDEAVASATEIEENGTESKIIDELEENIGSVSTSFRKRQMNSVQYCLFAHWIKEMYIKTLWDEQDFENVLTNTREDSIFPVWFDIKERSPEGELRIRTDKKRKGQSEPNDNARAEHRGDLLEGSDEILNRIEGKNTAMTQFAGSEIVSNSYSKLYGTITQSDS
ncbi:hypothetical protein [Halovenus aranensis]|nr:hypothetical protein [Halovenus aranensis]